MQAICHVFLLADICIMNLTYFFIKVGNLSAWSHIHVGVGCLNSNYIVNITVK